MRQFRANQPTSKVPAIMLTAIDYPVLKQQAIAGGVNFFLTKPVNKAEFLAMIKHLLNIL